MYDFSERYVVLTGCARGIGKAIAKAFLDANVKKIAMLDYDIDTLKQTAAELDPKGEKTLALKCNIADAQNVKEIFDEIKANFGRIDILVNNAGITKDHMFWKMTDDEMRAVMEVNFFGTYNCTRQVIPEMRQQKFGRIINMSSVSAHGHIGQTNYSSSKAAINGFSKSLAIEVARNNITVNTIEPAFVDTEMLRAVPEDKLAATIQGLPMQRLGAPEEIAALTLFLASDEASYVSGMAITCSGASRVY